MFLRSHHPNSKHKIRCKYCTRITYNQVKAHATSHVIGQKHVPVYLYELLAISSNDAYQCFAYIAHQNNESVHHAVNSFMFRLPSLFPIHYFYEFQPKNEPLCFCASTWVKRDYQPPCESLYLNRDYQPVCEYFYLSRARLSTPMRIPLPESSEIINPYENTSTWVKRDYSSEASF